MNKEIKISKGTYTNKSGEEKEFLSVIHPEHDGNVRLLSKKNDDGTRMTATEMVVFLKANKDWRTRLEFVVNEEYGNYFVISMVNYSVLDL
ncbi:MAG: hypothetical protein MUO60_11235 [Clostridiaceae bacterium]|nr:hypothetical protein [Clostridiaceae bacterium]